jgi:primosomal protein N' (replication factor Y) (superfamily II helicase)
MASGPSLINIEHMQAEPALLAETAYYIVSVQDIPKPLTYLWQGAPIAMGTLCFVPIKKKLYPGIVCQEVSKPSFVCQPIHSIPALQSQPIVFHQNQWILELSKYYAHPTGAFWNLCLQSRVYNYAVWEKHNDWMDTQILKHIAPKTSGLTPLKPLTTAQQTILVSMQQATKPFLLYGLTGSGKTEVYCHFIKPYWETGKTVLVLMPEIALLPQMVLRFQAYFGSSVAVLYSGLSAKQYYQQWSLVASQKATIILGVKTALWLPYTKLHAIIVDEEHDASYKHQDSPFYHCRDAAVFYGFLYKIPVILGSGTPSIESYKNAFLDHKYDAAILESKFSHQSTSIEWLQMAWDASNKGSQNYRPSKSSQIPFNKNAIHPTILKTVGQVLQAQEQAIVLINKRGYHHYRLCLGCQSPVLCPNCSVTVTLHGKGFQEFCHFCGWKTQVRPQCPQCQSTNLQSMGTGTQQILEELQEQFPQAIIERFDRDQFTSGSRMGDILDRFSKNATHILVGTQMLSKGHDFPNVTLVALLHIEDSLFIPDFRAMERTYQILVQTMGRTGRGGKPGQVMVQSLVAKHPVVQFALNYSLHDFYTRELSVRKTALLPPYSRQILCTVSHKEESISKQILQNFKQQLIQNWQLGNIPSHKVRIAGPLPAQIEKINHLYRFQLLWTLHKDLSAHRLMNQQLWDFATQNNIQIVVDPHGFL